MLLLFYNGICNCGRPWAVKAQTPIRDTRHLTDLHPACTRRPPSAKLPLRLPDVKHSGPELQRSAQVPAPYLRRGSATSEPSDRSPQAAKAVRARFWLGSPCKVANTRLVMTPPNGRPDWSGSPYKTQRRKNQATIALSPTPASTPLPQPYLRTHPPGRTWIVAAIHNDARLRRWACRRCGVFPHAVRDPRLGISRRALPFNSRPTRSRTSHP